MVRLDVLEVLSVSEGDFPLACCLVLAEVGFVGFFYIILYALKLSIWSTFTYFSCEKLLFKKLNFLYSVVLIYFVSVPLFL